MGLWKELKIVKDHWNFRLIKRTKPLAIHTECIHKENVWKAVKKFVLSGKKEAVWYVMTPTNYDFVKVETGCTLSPKQFEKTILERYNWLKKHGQEIQLHVHLRIKMSMYEKGSSEAKKKVKQGADWLKKHGFSADRICFGWWSYDKECEKYANKLGLKVAQRLDNYFIHDYDLVK